MMAGALLLAQSAFAPAWTETFPWQPARPAEPPPLNSPEVKPVAPLPEPPPVSQPRSRVPGHWSEHGGFVPGYEREGPPMVPLAPGEKSRGYIPGHYDENGAWVPGHSE